MCFNIAIAKTAEQIASFYGISIPDIPPLPEYYHVSGFANPPVPVLYKSGNIHPGKTMELMNWGLVPSWIKTVKDAGEIRQKTLNARCETKFPAFLHSAVHINQCAASQLLTVFMNRITALIRPGLFSSAGKTGG